MKRLNRSGDKCLREQRGDSMRSGGGAEIITEDISLGVTKWLLTTVGKYLCFLGGILEQQEQHKLLKRGKGWGWEEEEKKVVGPKKLYVRGNISLREINWTVRRGATKQGLRWPQGKHFELRTEKLARQNGLNFLRGWHADWTCDTELEISTDRSRNTR